jgi:secreted PhoX family phosphatase
MRKAPMTSSNPENFRAVLSRRISRRTLLRDGGALAACSMLPAAAWAQASGAAPLGFRRIAASAEDRVIVPEGYRADLVLRWGDPLANDVAPLDARRIAAGALLERGAAAAQARQFGFNCDGIGLFETEDGRRLICVNHEFPQPELMFPGWAAARRTQTRHEFVVAHPECVPVMQASVGVSVVELEYAAGWRYRPGSPFNRRITANTAIEFAGPALGHPLLDGPGRESRGQVFGTFSNCAAGTTPWGTYLTAEENTDDFFGNLEQADLEPALAHAYERFGARARQSFHRWEFGDPRFDAARTPNEPLKFGWVVEIDPRDASQPIKKRTALGRFKHEGATTVLCDDNRAAVYMGDDEAFEYFYKFVTERQFDPARPENNRDLLDSGTLYVARLDDDGGGEWLPLIWDGHPELTPERGFASQGDVVLRCREAADRVGATPLDRPEDVAVSPVDRRVYLACTENTARDAAEYGSSPDENARGADAGSPRAPNPSGHILELIERGGDPAATSFGWDVFVLAGDPQGGLLSALPRTDGQALAADATYFAGFTNPDEVSAFVNPDNLGFDQDGNLWIVTDGAQPGGNNNGCFVCPTQGPDRGAVRRFMSGPIGAEICGCEITPDGRTLFLTVQHPGSGGTVEDPVSRWPDGGDAAPRGSLVAIHPEDEARKLGE